MAKACDHSGILMNVCQCSSCPGSLLTLSMLAAEVQLASAVADEGADAFEDNRGEYLMIREDFYVN